MANLSNINNKFLVTTGGAVGVGVTSPGSKLSIGGTTGSYDSGIGFQPTGTGARIYRTFIATDGSFRFDDVTSGYLTRLTIQAGGNVGIGTTNPFALLTLKRGTGIGFEQTITTNVDTRRWWIQNDGVEYGDFLIRTASTKDASTPDLTRLYINNDGDVGIGTTSLTNSSGYNTLSISGTTGAQIAFQTSGSGKHYIYSTATDFNIYNSQAGNLKLFTNSAEKMRIDSSGNIGVGVTPESWGTNGDTRAIQISTMTSLSEAFDGTQLASNFYFDGTNDKYIQSDFATSYLQIDGTHRWRYAASGTADANITWSEAMRIDSSGNVGIGGNPSEKLTIDGTTNGAYVRISNAASGDISSGYTIYNGSNLDYAVYTNPTFGNTTLLSRESLAIRTGGSQRMVIDSSGNVGIGKYPTDKTLELYSAGNTALRIQNSTTGSGSNDGLLIETSISNGDVLIWNYESAALRFGTAGTERMRISSSGNVGIGTTGPSAKLDIGGNTVGSVQAIFGRGNSDSAFSVRYTNGITGTNNTVQGTIGLDYANGYWADMAALKFIRDSTAGELAFYTSASATSGVERMRITSGGDFEFKNGTLKVGDSTTAELLIIPSPDGFAPALLQFHKTDTASQTVLQFLQNNIQKGSITYSGTSTSFNTTSDYRLKENVVEMTGALDRVNQLRPSRFNFISDADLIVDGFLAHEVQEIVPEAITGEKDAVDEDGNPIYQGIDQSKLVPLLVGAIKELEARVKELENK